MLNQQPKLTRLLAKSKMMVLSAIAASGILGVVTTGAAQAAMYKVVGTGGTLHVRTGPSLSAPLVASLPDGTAINIICQTRGDQVVGSTMWDRISSPTVG